MDLHLLPLFLTLLVLLQGRALSSESNGPLVEVPGQGWFQGKILTSYFGNSVHGFLGIPYAKPPIGDLRFKEPQPPEPFHGIWDSTHFRSQCIQHRHLYPSGHEQVAGQEDCLYLNVYTPKVTSNKRSSLDVLIVIHGGAFMFGTGQFYGPNYVLDRNMILVTINYRLGPLGFLSLEDEVAPGNNGMRDQVAAMKWVNKNIANFGGNPESVYLVGLSAGGASVHYHYLSPLSRGLFRRGISLSGTALCPWALVEKPREKALKLAALVGCPTKGDSAAILNCLRQRPATDLVSAMSHFQVWLYNPFSPFGPVVEPKGILSEPFLPDDPFTLLSNGEFLHQPWITGVTTHEGLYPAADWVANEDNIRYLKEHFEEVVPHILHYNDTVTTSAFKETSQKIRSFYFGNNEIGLNQKEEMTKMCSDRLFLYASSKAAKLHSKFAPAYKYQFAYRGTYSVSQAMAGTDEDLGVCHGDDMVYFVSLVYVKPFEKKDEPVSDLLLNLFTSFMQKGIPESNGVSWKQVNPEHDSVDYLVIPSANNVKMVSSRDFGNEKFWDSLKLRELHHLKSGHDEL
ncbi:venom carboxylesterase-6-like isoform X2 [Hetaerina americana]